MKKGKVMSHPVDMTNKSQGRISPFDRMTEEFWSLSIEERCTLAQLMVSQNPGQFETPTLSEHQNILRELVNTFQLFPRPHPWEGTNKSPSIAITIKKYWDLRKLRSKSTHVIAAVVLCCAKPLRLHRVPHLISDPSPDLCLMEESHPWIPRLEYTWTKL